MGLKRRKFAISIDQEIFHRIGGQRNTALARKPDEHLAIEHLHGGLHPIFEALSGIGRFSQIACQSLHPFNRRAGAVHLDNTVEALSTISPVHRLFISCWRVIILHCRYLGYIADSRITSESFAHPSKKSGAPMHERMIVGDLNRANFVLRSVQTRLERMRMSGRKRIVAVVGPLGVFPNTRLSLPARRILAYMAIWGRPVARSTASAQLWPDVAEETGRANLRRALWNTPLGWISSNGDELELDAETDLKTAEAAAARAISGHALTFAEIRLLSDDILPGWHDEWILPLQDRFRALRVQALEVACRTMTRTGDIPLATQAGAAAIAAEPLRESAVEALIEAHLAQCNRYEALRCYRSLAERLEVELGVAPNAALADRFSGRAVA